MSILRIVLCLILVLCCWKWGGVKNWKKYYPTILYLIVNQLLYRFLVDENLLWRLEDDYFLNPVFSFLLQTFLIFPCMVILFLSNLPESWKKQILYLLLSAAILIGIETVMHIGGRITYHHGWNYGWSLIFNFLMVLMWRFHYYKPIPAWLISFLCAAFFIIYFHVPLPEH